MRIMKKLLLSAVCFATFTLVACVDGNKSKSEGTEAGEGQMEQTLPSQKAETLESEDLDVNTDSAPIAFDIFSAQMEKACGLEPIVGDKMDNIKVSKDADNDYTLYASVPDNFDGEGIQREYFNAFAGVADGNAVYGFHMDQSRGADVFRDYDEYVSFIRANGTYAKAQYGYDYKGKRVKVYCSAAFGDFGLHVVVE